MPVYTILDNYLVHNSVSEYDEVLLSIGALEWEKLVLDIPDLDDGKAGIGFISFILGIMLLPIIKRLVGKGKNVRN